MIKTIRWVKDRARIINQEKLPHRLEYLDLKNWQAVAEAIESMKIRGAPALGVAAAYGLVLAAKEGKNIKKVGEILKKIRPTARSISWAVERMLKAKNLTQEAQKIAEEDILVNQAIGKIGAKLIKSGDTILTHCNAGALATVDYGTALGIIRAAVSQGKKIKVIVAETRPKLQGARLTAWELKRAEIPVTLITDSMVGHFMKKGIINMVIVGADRIAKNGDVANKIGTYQIALLAKEHKIPFYVAAPYSTIDPKIKTGKDIPIEERNPKEVTYIGKVKIAPAGVKVLNPAFDVTPRRLITGIITERELI